MPLILTPPVEAPIVRAFAYAGSPFAAGLHRGVDFGAAPERVVRSPCSGELVWASQDVVSLDCGHRRVTLVDFEADATLGPVRTGDPVGRTGSSPLHLGVRRPADPFGYEDPERYLAAAPSGPPPVAPRAPPRAPRTLPSRAVPRPAPAMRAAPALAPPLAWAGLAAVLLGAAGGGALRRQHARRVTAAAVPAVAEGH